MIVHDEHKRARALAARRLFIILGGACLLLAMAALWPEPSPYEELPEGVLYCGAERVKGGNFRSRGQEFAGGSTQSAAYARNGQYSSHLPLGEGLQYGLGYTQERPKPGTAWKASIWRKQSGRQDTYLAVSLEGGAQPRYWQENIALERDGEGWERLEVRFSIPYRGQAERVKVYVYGNGESEAWFDDFTLEALPAPEAFELPRVELSIGPGGMKTLQANREKALQRGILSSDGLDWVAAGFIAENGSELPARVRLKGDWLDHLQGDKWSFRVKLESGQAWNRVRTFSLHAPHARYHLHEWLFHQLLESADVLTTRYDFVELLLNGESLGVYAWEEHFEKQLVESRNRREGPIMKFEEDAYWATIGRQLSAHGYVKPGAAYRTGTAYSAEIAPFDDKPSEENPAVAEQILEARSLMEQYRRGEVPARAIFDLPKMAVYLAYCDLVNARHGLAWHNQRFYYNPITGLLEPIGFDGYGGKPPPLYRLLGGGALSGFAPVSHPLIAQLFQEEDFTAAYLEALNRLSSAAAWRAQLDTLAGQWSARLQAIQAEYPEYKPSLQDYQREGAYVHSLLLPFEPFSLAAYTQSVLGPDRQLWVCNRHHLPLRLVGYGLREEQPSAGLDVLLPARPPRAYAERLRKDSALQQGGFLEEQVQQEQLPPEFTEVRVSAAATHLFFKVPGLDTLFSAPILPYAAPGLSTDMQRIRGLAELKPGQSYRVEEGAVLFPEGRHELRETLVVPPGYQLVMEAGAVIELSRGASLISFSPLQAMGTAGRPVRVVSPARDGGGLAVLSPGGPSTARYLMAEGLGAPREGRWQLTGALTFYEAPVSLSHCAIIKNRSEDALNTVRSAFELADSYIGETFSDGFDADFCKGVVRNCRLEQTGNDGLDFSGSTVTISDCQLRKNGDKGISVGEESDVTVVGTAINGAVIGMASKDLSVLRVKDCELADCDQGFAAYQKKPEFGPAVIVVESYQGQGLRRLFSAGEGSQILGL